MVFANEAEFEVHIRELIASQITANNPDVYALEYKTVGDIVVCREGDAPAVFFIEVKLYQESKGRLGIGTGSGAGIQPEILVKKPAYLEKHLRWLLGNNTLEEAGYWLVTSEVLRGYVAGGFIGKKQNNIQKALFQQVSALNEQELLFELSEWLLYT